MIVKDNVTDDEDTIIEDLKMAVKQHIGSFAVPHCFMVTTPNVVAINFSVHVVVQLPCTCLIISTSGLFCRFVKSTKFTVKYFLMHS